jgi:RNase H-fold protein (predicted Holliday junction resolvase)
MQDERYSTKQAEGLLKKYDYKYSQIKKIKDEASAVIILLRYIENNK